MDDKRKPVVGEKLYYLKRDKSSPLIPTHVSMVGRVYFHCLIEGRKVPFLIESWNQKPTGFGHGYDFVLYDSTKKYEEEIEEARIVFRLKEFFRCYLPGDISLKQLRKINKK